MAGLVGQNVNIAAGAVKIGKNIGRIELTDVGTITSGSFSVPIHQIHQIGILHSGEKSIGIRA